MAARSFTSFSFSLSSLFFLAVAAVALLLVARDVHAQTPVNQVVTGTVNRGQYAAVPLDLPSPLSFDQVYQSGVSVTLTSIPADCFLACLTDIAPAYPETSLWSDPSVCRRYLTQDSSARAFLRPGHLHMTLANKDINQCQYTIVYSGIVCNSTLYGPLCEPRQPAPTDTVTLGPGQVSTFEGKYSEQSRSPSYAYATIRLQPLATNATAFVRFAARVYDHPRFGPSDEEVQFDNVTVVQVPIQPSDPLDVFLEFATPPRAFNIYGDQKRLPLFYTVYADPGNTVDVSFTMVAVGEEDCLLEYYAGRECQYFTPVAPDTSTFNFSTTQSLAPWVDVNRREDFSIGIHAQHGSVVALLRWGNVPSLDLNLFDIKIPLASTAPGAQTAVRYYYSGNKVDLQEAVLYIAFFSTDPATPDSFLFWENHECPNINCGGHGNCTANVCTCEPGYPEPLCSTDVIENPTDLPPTAGGHSGAEKFLIAWGVLGGFAVIGLWGYLHRRRTQNVAGYQNM